MQEIKLSNGKTIPLELHRPRIVQKVNLKNVDERLKAIKKGGFNTFLLKTKDIFLDMLTDSGVNAMSDNQLAAMMKADDAYAGSESWDKFEKINQKIFNKKFILPVHQGRAAENIICRILIKKGSIIPMNYHFTTTKAHIEINGGKIEELFTKDALKTSSKNLFKGNMDLIKLEKLLNEEKKNIPFIRMEASTNLIGGQPFSLNNLKQVRNLADKFNKIIVLDASLIAENVLFIKEREHPKKSLLKIFNEISDLCDIIYFSGRKFGSARGGAICTNNKKLFLEMRELIPLFEGFITYGGMSIKEIEALSIGIEEMLDEDIIGQSPAFIKFIVNDLNKKNIPVITPAGALGCHVDAKQFLKHLPQDEFPAGSLAAAFFLVSGIRGMERGTISNDRNSDGTENLADMELLRLAFPRRVITLSQIKFIIDRLEWLFKNKELIGGLKWVEEPKNLRFFFGRLKPTSDWPEKLVKKFKSDFRNKI